MLEQMESKVVQRSCRLYQRLLVLYPRNHRDEYGPAILQLFRDQCRDAWAEERMRGLIGFWFRALVDLLKTSFLEHLSNLNRTMHMLSTFRPRFTPLSVFLPVFAAAFLLVVIGSTVITFLIPKTYLSTARVTVEQSNSSSQAVSGPDSEFDPNFLKYEFEVIQSHAVLTKTIDALNLREIWGRKYNGSAAITASKAEAVLRHSLDLQPVRNTKLIEIRAFSHNPDEAASLANGVAEAYQQYWHDHRLELARRGETASAATSTVTIIDIALPDTRPIGPNKPLNITFGVIVGLLLGFISGGISAGFIVWKRTYDDPSGSTPAASSVPAAFQDSASLKPGANLLMWIIGSFWISVGITFIILIFIFVLKIGSPPPGGNALVPLVFLLLEGSGVLTALAGFSLLREKPWAKIYIGIAALVVASWSAFGSLFPFPGPFRYLFGAFGLASLCTLVLSFATFCRTRSHQTELS